MSKFFPTSLLRIPLRQFEKTLVFPKVLKLGYRSWLHDSFNCRTRDDQPTEVRNRLPSRHVCLEVTEFTRPCLSGWILRPERGMSLSLTLFSRAAWKHYVDSLGPTPSQVPKVRITLPIRNCHRPRNGSEASGKIFRCQDEMPILQK
jgi:hypothetical protein